MTITSTQLSVTWAGNGSTQTFTYPFLIPSPGQCSLVYIDANGNKTNVARGLFSISNTGNSTGGTLTYPITGGPIPAGTSLTLTRKVPYQQAYHPAVNGPIYNPTLESALDALAMQIMQTASGLGQFTINGGVVTSANFTGALSVLVANGVATVNVQTTPGPQGIQGQQGIQGVTGATGATGARGSLWYDGSGAPGTIAGALAGDQYLDTVTGNVYQLGSGGAWAKTADIMGPQGQQGIQGNTGSGSSVIIASGGTALPNPATQINITGAGATVTETGSDVTINIPGGSLQLISQQVVTAGASGLNFLGVFTAAYSMFVVELLGFVPTAAGGSLEFQWGNSSGPTWETSDNYYGSQILGSTSASTPPVNYNFDMASATAVTIFKSFGGPVYNGATRSADASLKIKGSLTAGLQKNLMGDVAYSSTDVLGGVVQVGLFTTLTYDSFRLLMSSGTLAAGTVRVYGIV